MVEKFHLNPINGEVGRCRARVAPCPFGVPGEHFTSQDAARKDYEAIMAGINPAPLSWLLSARGEALTGPHDPLAFTHERYNEWKEFKACLTSDEAEAFYSYTVFGFEDINRSLRGLPLREGVKGADLHRVNEVVASHVAIMDEVFALQPVAPRVVYRYMDLSTSLDEFLASVGSSGTWHDPAFLSASATPALPLYRLLEPEAKSRPSKPKVMLELAVRKGVSLQMSDKPRGGSIQSLEHEVLLPRGLSFEVADVEKRKKVSLGGMESYFLEHCNTFHGWKRGKLAKSGFHGVPVVKLVETS